MFLEWLKEAKSQRENKKTRKASLRYFNLIFVFLAIIAIEFFVCEKTSHEPAVSFLVDEPEMAKQQALKEVIEMNPEAIKKPEKKISQLVQHKLGDRVFTATFTDSFSGQAWIDLEQTDLYFDWTGTNLLFPLSINIKEVNPQDVLAKEDLTKVFTDKNEESKVLSLPGIIEFVDNANPKQVVVVEAQNSSLYIIGLTYEKAFEIWQCDSEGKNLKLLLEKAAKYPGHLALLTRDNNVFILWASYFTLAYEINNNGVVKDLTSDFGWRVSSNNPVKLYRIKDFVYIVNKDGSVVRYNDEISVRIDQEFLFAYQPSFLKIAPNGYLITGMSDGNVKIYEFRDNGFNLSGTRQVVSKKVNFSVKNIRAAQISYLDGGLENSHISYFLSNDGGANWQEAVPGQIVIFENKNNANDLRWKVVITPMLEDNPIQRKTPYLSSINFRYWYEM